jgi:hypothetical protein
LTGFTLEMALLKVVASLASRSSSLKNDSPKRARSCFSVSSESAEQQGRFIIYFYEIPHPMGKTKVKELTSARLRRLPFAAIDAPPLYNASVSWCVIIADQWTRGPTVLAERDGWSRALLGCASPQTHKQPIASVRRPLWIIPDLLFDHFRMSRPLPILSVFQGRGHYGMKGNWDYAITLHHDGDITRRGVLSGLLEALGGFEPLRHFSAKTTQRGGKGKDPGSRDNAQRGGEGAGRGGVP